MLAALRRRAGAERRVARLSLLDRRLWRHRRRLGRRDRADRHRAPHGAQRGRCRLAGARRAGVPPARHLRPRPLAARPCRARARRTASMRRARCSAASMSTTSCAGSIAGLDAPAGAYNLADDLPAQPERGRSPSPPRLLGLRTAAVRRARRRCRRWRAVSMPRTAASRTARRSACSAGRRSTPITAPACAPSAR